MGALNRCVFVVFVGLAAAPAFGQCEDPQSQCGRFVEAECLASRVGAGALAVASVEQQAVCEDQFAKYRTCLADVTQTCGQAAGAPAAATGCTPDIEKRLWDEVKGSNDAGELSIFVETCPDSPFALVAKRRMGSGGGSAAAATQSSGLGEAVYRAAQTELRRLGHYRGGIDGDWGAGSQRALRAFQSQAGMPVNGQLTEATLAALKAAPTLAAPAAQPGYVGAYQGGWSSPQFGTSGRSEFLAMSYDPNSGALRGRMGIEYQGVMHQGVMTGTVTLASGGRLSGRITAPDGTGWNSTIRLEPAANFDVMRGSFTSVPLPGTWGATTSGYFETRRVK